MFYNVGGKIKTLAKVLCWIGTIANIITAIVMFALAADSWGFERLYIGLGFAFLILGPLFSLIGSFILYGFGQLVENSDEIVFQNNKLINTIVDKKNYNKPLSNFLNAKTPSNLPESQHKWRCVFCGEMISSNPCPCCGNNNQEHIESSAPHRYG